jgi:hypothetical protein
MASAENTPPEATEGFELPSNDNSDNPNRKGVSWSATPKENEQETIEKRKMPIQYQIEGHLSIKTVLKETHTMFLATDPSFLLVSKEDSTVIIKTAADIDKISTPDMKKFFPARLVNGRAMLKMYIVSTMGISRLKRSSYGYYNYASRNIWIMEDPFESEDVRNFGFIIRKDPRRVSRDTFTAALKEIIDTIYLTDDDTRRYNEAKKALPFDGPAPKFQVRISSNIYHQTPAGRVQTTALTVHCDKKHLAYLAPLFTKHYEEGSTDERFVPHSLLHGNNSIHQRAYRNAIILQNQYLDEVRSLPVIGISPKALQQKITTGTGPAETVLSLLNRYHYFSSIEPTTKSEELGLYFFLTTGEKFDQGMRFVTTTLPKIWAKLDNTFLDELPASVRCPRLTTSNLSDDNTTNTAKMLTNVFIPDDVTVASKWSRAPRINKPPTKSVVVNYDHDSFPALPPTQKHDNSTPKQYAKNNSTAPPLQQFDNVSTHSNASATSAGTSFTREEGQSLFTSLTESLMSDIKSQTDAVLKQNETLMSLVKSQTDQRAEQLKQNELNETRIANSQKEMHERHEAMTLKNDAKHEALTLKNDAKFERMMAAFMQHSAGDHTTVIQPSVAIPSATPKSQLLPTNSSTTAMDTAHENNTTTDPIQRPMDTADDATTEPTTAPQLVKPTARPLEETKQGESSEYHQPHTHHETPTQPKIAYDDNSWTPSESSDSDETQYSTKPKTLNEKPAFDWLEDDNSENEDEEYEWSDAPWGESLNPNTLDDQPQSTASPNDIPTQNNEDEMSFATVDSDDPTHEKYAARADATSTSTSPTGTSTSANGGRGGRGYKGRGGRGGGRSLPSPPRVTRTNQASPEIASTNNSNLKPSEDVLAVSRQRRETPIEKVLSHSRNRLIPQVNKAGAKDEENHAQAVATRNKHHYTIGSPTTPAVPNTAIEKDAESPEWSLVTGNTKRKAKGSPAKRNTEITLRKQTPLRSTKKQIREPASPKFELPAEKN